MSLEINKKLSIKQPIGPASICINVFGSAERFVLCTNCHGPYNTSLIILLFCYGHVNRISWMYTAYFIFVQPIK